MTINKANVKKAVLAVNPDLRVSKEFYEGLDELVQAEVKKAVESLYEVKVEKVNLLNTSRGLKKAYVKLKPGYKASDLAIKLGIL